MEHTVRFEQAQSRPLAVVRRRAEQTELSRVVPEACGTVWEIIRARQLGGAGRNVALYWDGEINLDVGVEFDAPFAGAGDLVPSQKHLPEAQCPHEARGLRAWSSRRITRAGHSHRHGSRPREPCMAMPQQA